MINKPIIENMFLSTLKLSPDSVVMDIVNQDPRTAEVFRKYDIEYCCGGKWPLSTVCMMKDIQLEDLVKELKKATRNLAMPATVAYENWSIDFLTEYIVNIHHTYLNHTLPEFQPVLVKFLEEHVEKYPALATLEVHYKKLHKEMIPHLRQEEETVFPYIRQLAHAYEDKDTYAALLVKTLRKPIVQMMHGEHELTGSILTRFRDITDNYTPPEKACTSHKVVYAKLKELDNDIVQHIFLENQVLFPKALFMEKELLGS